MSSRFVFAFAACAALAGCSAGADAPLPQRPLDADAATPGEDAAPAPADPDARAPIDGGARDTGADAPAPPRDAGILDASDAAPPACVTQYGTAMSPVFGRIDGTLVAVDTPSDVQCPHDDNHVILQVRMGGSVYPLWVNIGDATGQIGVLERGAPLGLPAFGDGWHTDATLDYATTLGLHSTDFTDMPPDAVVSTIASALTVGHPIAIYATGFSTNDGGHDVHRRLPNADGAIVIDPATAPRYLLFRFATQTF